MEIKLGDNIRAFRKERSLTQEQLAEVLGVTVGAVYKWEAGLSHPELGMIMSMADFFDCSVDVLLGYEMKDNRLEAAVERLREYIHDKNPKGIEEAEKALKKYPHVFEVVHQSAVMYRLFGLETQNSELLSRALELLQESILLLPQNKNPEINRLSIYGEIADIYLMTEQAEKAIELLKQHNVSGIYSDMIGYILTTRLDKPEEALPFLSEALLKNTAAIIRSVVAYLNVYFNRKDYDSAQAILLWAIGLIAGLKDEGKPNFLDKLSCVFRVSLAYVQLETGRKDDARSSLIKAKEIAESFDANPVYDAKAVRFVSTDKQMSAYDDLGASAIESVINTVKSMESEELTAIWKEVE